MKACVYVVFHKLNIFHCSSYIFDSIYERLYVFEILYAFNDEILFIVEIKKVYFFCISLLS